MHGATLNQTKPVVSNTKISLTFGWSKTSRGDFHFLQDQNEHIFVHHDKTFIDPWYGPDSTRPYFLRTCNTYQNSNNFEAPIRLFEAWFVYSRKVYSNVITDPARQRWPRGERGGGGGQMIQIHLGCHPATAPPRCNATSTPSQPPASSQHENRTQTL